MKFALRFLVSLSLLSLLMCGRVDETKISIMGSSVSYSEGADSLHGYIWQYNELLAQRFAEGKGSIPWHISNLSVPGNNTVDILSRYQDLLSDKGKYVIFALSMGDEGLKGGDKEKIFEQFRDNLLALVAKARENGKVPVVTNDYVRGDYTEEEYEYIKRINLLIHEWDVPSVNLLGAIDDGYGRWVEECEADPYHPNDDGHREMFYTMVPSLFDALKADKPQPKYYTERNLGSHAQVYFEPENRAALSFTISFDIRTQYEIETLCIHLNNGKARIRLTEDGMTYSSPSGTLEIEGMLTDWEWHNVTLTHFHARGETLLYADGELVGSLKERFTARKFYVGDYHIDLSQLMFFRSGMNADEIKAINDGKLLKSSLELYCPLEDGDFKNYAQSLNKLYIIE